MKILVTGGAGFIGTNLIKRLLKEKHEVVSWDNYSTGLGDNHLKHTNVTYVEFDIAPSATHDQYSDLGPKYHHSSYLEDFDIVYHLAAIARIQPSFDKPLDYFGTNASGTMEIAKMCVDANIPLIYAGSSSHHSGKYKNPYTFSKTIGEEALEMFKQNFGLKYSIARFYNVYGPHQLTEGGYTTLIGRWMNNIEKGLPCEIYGDGEQRRDFTHVDDIVDALIKIMKQQEYGRVFELGRGKNHSVNEVAEMFGIDPIYKDAKPGEARNTLCESITAREFLNWSPQKDLLSYIKEFKYENKFYNTKSEQSQVS